jgi:tetratricopeptide (TPR) repeat protein
MSKKRRAPAKPVISGSQPAASRPLLLRDVGLAALLIVMAVLAYWPALQGDFLWDDAGHVTRAEMQSVHGLWRTWFELGSTAQYYPLLHTMFWIEHRLWQDEAVGYHVATLLLHILASLLVVAVVRQLDLPGAWLAGFLFALHPVCVESVAWISEQKNTLSAVFYLAGALIYLKFEQTRRWAHYFAACGLFILALLSKTVTVTLPVALLVVVWWRRGKLEWKRDLLPLLPWLPVGAAAGLLTAWVERTYVGATGPDFSLTLVERFMLAGRVALFYAVKLLWPMDLMFVYPRWTIQPDVWWQWSFSLAVVALGIGLCVFTRTRRLARTRRGPLAAYLYFLVTLFPALGFFNVYPFIYSYVADHFQYLASLGFFVPLAWAVTVGARALPSAARWSAASVLILILTTLTWRQAHIYVDADTHYQETLKHNPGAWLAHNNLGSDLIDIPGRLPDAVSHIQAALAIKPDNAMAHYNLGRAFAKMPARLPDAVVEFQNALRISPSLVQAHDALGKTLGEMGRTSDSIAEHETATRLSPSYAATHNDLGSQLAQAGRIPEALAEFDAALKLEPTYVDARSNRALALARMGRATDAVEEFETALRARPDYAPAHTGLGGVLLRLNRDSEAIVEFRKAAEIEPASAQAHFNLGFALAKAHGQPANVIEQYRDALRLRPDFFEAHVNLGNALSATGQKAEALSEYRAALRIRPDSGPTRRLVEQLEEQ